MKKKIIYKDTIEESDYNRVKDIDSENYISRDGKTVLPKLTQMPLRDLAILSFTDENELKKNTIRAMRSTFRIPL